MNTPTLFRAVLKKQLILLVRYPVNTVSQLATIYALFAIIFFGGGAVAGPQITDSLGGIIVGFFLFTLSIVAYSGLSWDMTREAQWGTLEQLYMSPYGFGTVVITKVVVNALLSFGWGAVILVSMLVTTQQPLHLDPLTIIPLGILTVASAIGIGFVLGGVALLYKRIENAFQLVQFAFIAFLAAPVGEHPLLKALPLAQGSHLLQRSMRDGIAIWNLPMDELGLLALNAIVYFVVGYLFFQRMQRRARQRGVMGHY